ncbi:uncharacterized protein LOC108115564 [Drosophila eugracilis]|uniref:uncharacterized protein LOC108115564 n=1 Tax=Drosophila eugracilis TaxID=29029 RepID=UPI001BDA5D43|nr:uncharacterized protein LOC108115564 [Drosophila eugracilis]
MYLLKTKIIFILFLSLKLLQGSDFPQLKKLNKIVRLIKKEEKFETIMILQHHLHDNCKLRDWNPLGTAIIRTNDLGNIKIKANFKKYVLAIVCIGENSHIGLLKNLADAFENMRQERIILWTQIEVTAEFLNEISKKSTEFDFYRLIVLDGNQSENISYHQLDPIPSAHMNRIENVWKLNSSVFYKPIKNFQGKTALVRRYPNGGTPTISKEDMEIIEFAKKHNVTLKFLEGNLTNTDQFDIQLTPRLVRKNLMQNHIKFVNPYCSTSIVVVVPCGTYRSFHDFLQQSGVQKWILYIIFVYIIFVLIEVFILKVTYWITRERNQQMTPQPLVNLYAFRAILGLPYPEHRRASPSLRQLFLAIVVFGMIFSNFMNCKLSAMLTRPFIRPQVMNFEELAQSGLTTVIDENLYSFMESELGEEVIQKVMPRKLVMSYNDRVKLFLSTVDNYAYPMLEEHWENLDKYQKSKGIRAYCTSKFLTIVENWPRVYVLQNNSLFQWPLSRFVMFLQESGITRHWQKDIPKLLMTSFNVSSFPVPKGHKYALCVEQLKGLWYLLILGYSVSILVFLGEIYMRKRRRTFNDPELMV